MNGRPDDCVVANHALLFATLSRSRKQKAATHEIISNYDVKMIVAAFLNGIMRLILCSAN